MCGIAGIVQRATAVSARRLAAMRDAMAHRGPDDCGAVLLSPLAAGAPRVLRDPEELADDVLQGYTVGLAHRRLAIIDLSPGGHQPMHDPATGNWVTFNGEIYNYRELRRELAARGQTFASQSDTEIILKAYAVWGAACVARLRGIFAFALYDRRLSEREGQPSLLLARDPLGVKPLYYYTRQGLLLFASEVRALLASALIPRRLDPRGVCSYLAYGSVQEPFTLVQAVRSLPPGHLMLTTSDCQQVRRYWQLPAPPDAPPVPRAEVYAAMREQLSAAVTGQLCADVPLGAFLSGGIDSTSIVALMTEATACVNTFSIGFDEPDYDERRYARAAADHLGTTHRELLLRGEEVQRALPNALLAYDQPSVDGLNTYFISKVTREAGLTVALSGVGGDELFGGYNGYARSLMAERWGRRLGRLPRPLRAGLGWMLRGAGRTEPLRKALQLLETKRQPYFVTRQLFHPYQAALLLADALYEQADGWQETAFAGWEAETAGYDAVNRIAGLEMRTYMLSTLLRDTDQMSMAHALEVRVPLIDPRLVEFTFQLPGAWKLEDTVPKPLLTRALGTALPDVCVHRPKRGFELPFARWLRAGLRDQIRGTLLSPASAAVLCPAALQAVWEQFGRGQLSWSRVWSLFILCQWVAMHGVT